MHKILIVAALAAVALSACAKRPPDQVTYTSAIAEEGNSQTYIDPGYIKIKGIPGEGTYKFYDMEEGNVCYIWDGYNAGSITCLPLNKKQ